MSHNYRGQSETRVVSLYKALVRGIALEPIFSKTPPQATVVSNAVSNAKVRPCGGL